ncbi:MAG TPA: hypothetical protein VFL83_05060 [Anaeromyxobacter sp.]|nr:hypothetical protein [Anaeromyxobacter sp.]
MASKKRPGSAKRTVAKQEAARKRSAPGKRFVGETAEQSERARQGERKKVARMARAARKAKRAEAARTAGAKRRGRGGAKRARKGPAPAPERLPAAVPDAEATFRAAEQEAALAGAEVEPLGRPLATVTSLPAREDGDPGRRADAEAAARAVATEDVWDLSADVSREHGGGTPIDGPAPPFRWAMADLVRSAFGLARTVVVAPLRLALAVPRLALRAVVHP